MNKEFKQAYAQMASDPTMREAVAELLVEFIEPNHLAKEIMSLFVDTRSLNPGDALVKKVRRGISVRTLVPGSIHLSNEITVTDRINYVLEGADIRVTANLWELESGEIGTVESIRSEMRAELTDYYVNRVFTLLTDIWNASNTPDNYTNVGGSLTAVALKNAIDEVNQKVGSVRAVVGTRKALTPITTFGAGWDIGNTAGNPGNVAITPALEEIYRTGWLGTYYGAPIVALNQIYNNLVDYTAMIPEDKVLVIGESAGEFVLFGDVREKTWDNMEPTPPQFNVEIYQQFGLIIDNAQGIYVLGGIS